MGLIVMLIVLAVLLPIIQLNQFGRGVSCTFTHPRRAHRLVIASRRAAKQAPSRCNAASTCLWA